MSNNILSNKSVLLTATMLVSAGLITIPLTSGIAVAEKLVETSTETDINVDVGTNVVFDEEDCEKANSKTSQENTQSTNQDDASLVQQGLHVGLNINVGTNVILTDNCTPSTEVVQDNTQEIEQDGASFQRGDIIGQNHDYQTEVIVPISQLT